MMRYIGFIFALIVFSFLGVAFWYLNETLPKAKAPDYSPGYSQALASSKQDGKPVILVFTASWCGPCQYMKKNVYPSPLVAAVSNRFHWLMVDTDDPSNQALARQYGVRGIPHIQVVDGSGREKGRVVGGRSPEDFAAFLRSQL